MNRSIDLTRQIRRVAIVLLAGFVVVVAALGYWQTLQGPALAADPRYNAARLQRAAERIARGRIFDRAGVVLADSVAADEGTRRVYPERSLAPTVGYASRRYGLAGAEAAFDEHLLSTRWRLTDGLGARLLNRSAHGADVSLTIDARIQRVAAAALGEGPGAVVALDPRTGEVLALVSAPTFDPNELDRQFARIAGDPGHLLLNRATQGLYAPGSTFKTVTLAAALDQRVATPATTFDCQDRYIVGGFAIKCDPVGRYDLAHAYAMSCNACFAQLGLQVGPDRLTRYARAFGFEAASPIEIPAERSLIQRRPNFIDDDVARAVTGMGQGELLATPLQMALVAATVANGGEVPPVHLLREVRLQGEVVARYDGPAARRIVRPETAQAISAMMVKGVREGWAKTAAIPGVAVAGKTGTAEVGPNVAPHAWFIGFAPAEHPVIAVAVIKENAGAGSEHAGPVARAVMQAALQ
ncbi:MAG: hypothetical protein HYY04_04870 [Chloroflexi bacterium]|nr:hypothetical protein [Chloroflexota bacterium]